jgi:Arm DNA-binding domain
MCGFFVGTGTADKDGENMGRSLGKLTARYLSRASNNPASMGTAAILYLQVESATAKSWVFRYAGRYMGLGSAVVVWLQEARDLAHEFRKRRREGVDPIEAKRAEQAQRRLLPRRSHSSNAPTLT